MNGVGSNSQEISWIRRIRVRQLDRRSPQIYNNKWPQEGVSEQEARQRAPVGGYCNFCIGRFFFHGVRVNWKQKQLSDWFVFEITFLLWRWRHKIQNTHAINFQTRASLVVRDFCCSEVKKKKKSPREKKFQFFSILVFPTTKTLMKWTTTHATIVPVF